MSSRVHEPGLAPHAMSRLTPITDEGTPLDATFTVNSDDGLTLVLESRSGRRGTPQQRNADYGAALLLILRRLVALGASLVDGVVDSTTARKLRPDPRARRLEIPGGYPIVLDAVDIGQLRAEIGRAGGTVARRGGASGGGNREKRIRLWLDVPGWHDEEAQDLATLLATGGPAGSSRRPMLKPTPPTTGSRSQGHVSDAAFRRAVELRAMALAVAAYEEDDWTVEDTSQHESFDLLCVRDGQEMRVEVKGTTGMGEVVHLTANEVANARAHRDAVTLFIVHGIKVESGPNGLEGRGGSIRELHPWDVGAGTLRAVAYTWSPKRG